MIVFFFIVLLWTSVAFAADPPFVPNDDGTALGGLQAGLFSQDFQIQNAAQRGNGVLSGCAVTPGTTGLQYNVSAGAVQRERTYVTVAGVTNNTLTTADATNTRIDIVSINNTGAVVYTAGTAAANPIPPAIPQVSSINNIVCAYVFVPALLSTLVSGDIIDKRIFVNQVETIVVVTSDVAHTTSNTTLSDVTGLTLPITSSSTEVWGFTCTLLALSTGTAADWKFGWTVPASATMVWSGLSDQGVAPNQTPQVGTQATTLSYGGTNATIIISLSGVIFSGGTSGSVQLQFAQQNVSAQTTTIKKGSYCSATKTIN